MNFKKAVIYGFYNKGECFYIGSTKDFVHRLAQHKVDYRKRLSPIYLYIQSLGYNETDCWEKVEIKILKTNIDVDNKEELWSMEKEEMKKHEGLLNVHRN
tara:strand:+ start:2478 stop:2777 length:300 start_codon:yes stop_codon:yes gene_type:complete